VAGPSVLVVLGTSAWRSWVLPFLEDPRFDVAVLEGDPDASLVATVRRRVPDVVAFLSRHETLRRDAAYVPVLRSLGTRHVVVQPDAVVRLAFDKRAMARRAWAVDGLLPIPDFAPKDAQLYLERGGEAVVAKPCDGTEGQGVTLFHRPTDLVATGARLFEGGYLLQPFLEGEELSINLVWAHGQCNAYPPVAKGSVRRDGRHPTRRVRHCPAPLSREELEPLVRACVEYMRPFRPSGLVALEFIRTARGFFLLDVNPRVSGTMRMTAASAASNPFTDLLAAAAGVGGLNRAVAAVRPSREWPAPPDLAPDLRERIRGQAGLWLSSRVTLVAPSEAELARRAAELGRAVPPPDESPAQA